MTAALMRDSPMGLPRSWLGGSEEKEPCGTRRRGGMTSGEWRLRYLGAFANQNRLCPQWAPRGVVGSPSLPVSFHGSGAGSLLLSFRILFKGFH